MANTQLDCYTDDWQRTNPDFVVYLPRSRSGPDGYADHFLVNYTPGGDLLAMWTQSSVEGSFDTRVVFSRSEDEGHSWSAPELLVGARTAQEMPAYFGVPVISATGRIYCFYKIDIGFSAGGFRLAGAFRCHYSDDDGRTWQEGGVDIPVRRTRFDHPDPKVPCNFIIWQNPIRDAKNRPLAGFSRSSSPYVFPLAKDGIHGDVQCEMMRFDNIDEGPEAADIQITWLPEAEGTLRVPSPIEPQRSRGYSIFYEPSIVVLPDERLFLKGSTETGRIWYSISDDHGATWRQPEVMRSRDRGAEMLHPAAPAPLYALEDGRFLLLFHNHDGYSYGAHGPRDVNSRRPLFMAVGEFRPDAYQPIWFSEAKMLCDTECVGVGPEELIWLAMYSSLTEREGRRILWYPDRKHFLLGRYITNEMLADMTVPQT